MSMNQKSMFPLARISPEKAGISSEDVLGFYRTLEENHLNTHGLILARGNNIFAEAYYAPFHKDFKHRMYSVSKSYVSAAIGLLIEDGKLKLSDRFVDFFPEYVDPDTCDPLLAEMTIRDALRMETCHQGVIDWFHTGTDDRTKLYFQRTPDKIPGTIYFYDSPASYMLCVIAEKLCGKPFLEFLKDRFLRDIGFSEDAYCLKCPGGHSFGDSGILCTTRDTLLYARFVMNGGVWNGKRYMNAQYLEEATGRQTENAVLDGCSYINHGYGYQIWRAPDGGFAFVGMGEQLAICDRRHDTILVITSDNQGSDDARFLIYHAYYTQIIAKLGNPLPENESAYRTLCEYESTRRLRAAAEVCSPAPGLIDSISGQQYTLRKNPMGIQTLHFDFSEDRQSGTFFYTNAQGAKELRFAMHENVFQKFPQKGYSGMIGGAPDPENRYECAVSANWIEPEKLHLKVQAIDTYFGQLDMMFVFRDRRISIAMVKTAEAFFEEYSGIATGDAVTAGSKSGSGSESGSEEASE